jgi:hypothetical protein
MVTVVVVICGITWSVTRRRETFRDGAGTGVDYEQFFAIVNAYKTTLDRQPSEAEIQMQKRRLESDPTFDIPTLETTLRQSGEYRRLVALQRNTVYAELEGTMTDRQVVQKVIDVYREAAGSDPDDATTAFLLERYRHARLDDGYLRRLAESIAVAPDAVQKQAKPDVKPDAGSGSDLRAILALYDDLGIDATSLKGRKVDPRVLVKEMAERVRKARAKEGAGGTQKAAGSACPADPQLADMPPDALSKLVSERSRENLKTAACANTWLKTMDELKAAGYGEGKKIGSWTMPEKLRAPVCVGGRDGAYGPVNAQSALLGTLLTDNVTENGDMNLL